MKGFVCFLLVAVCAITIGCGSRNANRPDDPKKHRAMWPDHVEQIQKNRTFRVVREPAFNPLTGFSKVVVARDDGFEFAALVPQGAHFPKGAHVQLYWYTFWTTDGGRSAEIYTVTE